MDLGVHMPDFRTFNTLGEIGQGMRVAEAYSKGELIGWGGEELAREAFSVIKSSFYDGLSDHLVKNAAGRKMFLWDIVRKVLGKDTQNYPQEIGDCVSFGAKNATEYLTCCEILIGGEREKFRNVFPPYYYGTGRLYVGGGRMGNEDGSLGSWMAEAVMKYGTLFADEKDVPRYAGSVAKSWGGPNGRSSVDKWKPTAEKFKVKSAAKINSWAELVAAIVNGYPCTVASNQGFAMTPDSNGFHAAQGNWSHQMCIVGVDEEHATPHAYIINNWGDVHGQLKSFYDNSPLPVGLIRAKKSAIERMIAADETFAYSQFDGFPEQDLDAALFKLIG
jgi:hypothetical protein